MNFYDPYNFVGSAQAPLRVRLRSVGAFNEKSDGVVRLY